MRQDPFQGMPVLDWDGVFALALFVPTLFIAQFRTYGAAAFIFVTLGCAVIRRRSLVSNLYAHWYVLLIPALVIGSTVWSDLPAETLKHSIEFSVTVLAALLLSSSRNPRAMMLGLFMAFLLYAVVAAISGNKVDVGNNGARAFSGLGESKNETADFAGAGFVISGFLALTALRARRWLQSTGFAAAAGLQVWLAVAAMSSGAIGGMVAAVAVLLPLLGLRKTGKPRRAAFLAAAGACTFAMVVIFEFTRSSILSWLAFEFGKDPTLTGRTYLWFRAKELVAEHPILGRGFGAFWQQGNLDAEGLWQFAQITSREGFNFHSTLYDTLVGLGWAGAVLLALVFVLALGRLAREYVARPTLISCFWLAMAVYLFIRMPTECVGLTEFYFSTVLLYACLGSVKPSPVAALHLGHAAPTLAAVRAPAG